MTANPLAILLTALLATGCAAPEVLDPRDGAVPAGVDLSGNWRIRNDRREDARRLREAIRRTDGMRDDEVFRPSSRPPGGSTSRSRSGGTKGGLVYVFLETGSSLKVTQTRDGMFIAFDRAVVEEYRFGENRIINVGEVQAQRVTGWEGEELVVETLDRNSMKLTERFALREGGAVLERTITFRSKKGEQETIVQLFDRE